MSVMKDCAATRWLAAPAGCAPFFGRSTKDPAVMLKWAWEEFSSKDEPVIAEEHLHEAIEIYDLFKINNPGTQEYRFEEIANCQEYIDIISTS